MSILEHVMQPHNIVNRKSDINKANCPRSLQVLITNDVPFSNDADIIQEPNDHKKNKEQNNIKKKKEKKIHCQLHSMLQ